MTTSPSEGTRALTGPAWTLVVGSDGALAEPLIRELHGRGREVVVVGTAGFGLAREFGGNARSVDFGLSGANYKKLIENVSRVIIAVEPDRSRFRDPAASQHVRAAAESLEFIEAGGAPDGATFLSSFLAFGTANGTVGEGDFDVGQGFGSVFEESLALSEQVIRRARAHTSALGILRIAPLVGSQERKVLDQGSILAEVVGAVRAGGLHAETVWTDRPFLFETVDRAGRALARLSQARFDGVKHLLRATPPTDREFFEWIDATLDPERPRAPRLLGLLRRAIQSTLTSPERRAFGWHLRFGVASELSTGDADDPAWTDVLSALLNPLEAASPS